MVCYPVSLLKAARPEPAQVLSFWDAAGRALNVGC